MNVLFLCEAITYAKDGSSFAVLALLPTSYKSTEAKTKGAADGAILLFDVGKPTPVSAWFVNKVNNSLFPGSQKPIIIGL